ncbi:EAL domain-containing protein [sulfur-oxidizing endosymbiont of Gigantopelta aegis]|uniref:EAL domain-containing protein n=1 Tax=sulfur-oxidizing endosymbiont of Gigantopelta aegis TaxID=2794934 RepID=UPI0018DBD1C4|nr:EAL domain-containing protein [sulfur-oxidizing endosymbiont of Gigantopelta aegis]
MNDTLFLVDDNKNKENHKHWKVLIVDDDQSVHTVTNVALKNKLFDGKKLQILTAMSAKEAKKILAQHDDIALALIDVVMETPDAGLELINHIRNDLDNEMIRLVLRTGQPNQAPEESVINLYDINDYKEKTELTAQKLYTLLRTSLKQYAQIQALKESRDEIYKKMTTNEVTRLPNRMKLNDTLDSIGQKSLILINIDDFSSINDTQGYDIGDQLLQSFAEFLTTKLCGDAIVFHLQADEFALLLYDDDIEETQRYVKMLKEDVAAHTFNAGINSLLITVSIGIVLHESGNIIQKAEYALKEARHYGKNHSQTYTDDLNIIRTIHANSLWTARVRKAIIDNRIHAYFQPIINLTTNKIDKYETLIRLEYDGEIFSPSHFLEAAFYSCQIFDMFKIMFAKACEQTSNSETSFSINVSEYDLKNPMFFEFIKTTLINSNTSPDKITLEILEHKSISSEIEIQKLINQLHDFGLKISIDDFGSHCSNFAQLCNISIDYIKIDGIFIKDIVENKESQIISKTIIDYA